MYSETALARGPEEAFHPRIETDDGFEIRRVGAKPRPTMSYAPDIECRRPDQAVGGGGDVQLLGIGIHRCLGSRITRRHQQGAGIRLQVEAFVAIEQHRPVVHRHTGGRRDQSCGTPQRRQPQRGQSGKRGDVVGPCARSVDNDAGGKGRTTRLDLPLTVLVPQVFNCRTIFNTRAVAHRPPQIGLMEAVDVYVVKQGIEIRRVHVAVAQNWNDRAGGVRIEPHRAATTGRSIEQPGQAIALVGARDT